jgi:hypothetical protein
MIKHMKAKHMAAWTKATPGPIERWVAGVPEECAGTAREKLIKWIVREQLSFRITESADFSESTPFNIQRSSIFDI